MTLFREWEMRQDEGAADPTPVRALGYRLHLVGRSVVYHAHDSGCSTGATAVAAGRLAEDSEPHSGCNAAPWRELKADTLVDLEEDRFAIHHCHDVTSLLERLAGFPDHPVTLDDLSQPSQRLLARASPHDEPIAAAVAKLK